jgi:YegS/Rv2252/BmrU family lipid kinase
MARKLIRAKLIFNLEAGKSGDSPVQLTEILSQLQDHDIITEVYVAKNNTIVKQAVKRAAADGTELIIAAGGDGTITRVATAIIETSLVLGIIPTGTRNNLAVSLGIPSSIPDAVAILRAGKKVQVDVGKANLDGETHWFFEALSMGLMSETHSAADDVQKGDLSRVGELVSTIVSSTPSQVDLKLDDEKMHHEESVHVVLVANMPYIGANLHIAPDVSFSDNLLDVFLFSDMTKAQLITTAIRSAAGPLDDSVKHFRARKIKITATPDMAITADGKNLDKGTLKIKAVPAALSVMAGTSRGRGPKRAEVAELKQADNG